MSVSTRAARVRQIASILLLTFAILSPAQAGNAAPLATITIDHFDAAQGPLVATLGSPASSSVSGANVLGSERDMQVTVISGSPASASAQALDSQLLHSQDTGIVAQTLVQWDGADGLMTLDPNGLGAVDLTAGNSQNALAVTVLLNDLPIDLKFTIYSGANSSSATLSLPGGQSSGAGPKDYHIPYAAFATVGGNGANFSSVGAVELLIDGINDASDLMIGEVRTAEFDWGDLPDNTVGGPNYPTQYSANGPRHVIGSLYLGSLIDPFELNGIPSTGATGDDTSGSDDEDGVSPTTGVKWQQGASGGSVDVTVTGGPGCLSGWIDWNSDGDLSDAGENVLSNVAVDTGSSTHSFFIPVNPHDSSFYARFRLFAPDAGGGCTSTKEPTGQAVNGEVEDYRWSFGPNAVNIASFSASAVPVGVLPVAGVVVMSSLALLAAGWRILRG